jgi:hypothetical protein
LGTKTTLPLSAEQKEHFQRVLTAVLFIAAVTTVITMVTFQEVVNAALFVRTAKLV